jgi:hypothetical protein
MSALGHKRIFCDVDRLVAASTVMVLITADGPALDEK